MNTSYFWKNGSNTGLSFPNEKISHDGRSSYKMHNPYKAGRAIFVKPHGLKRSREALRAGSRGKCDPWRITFYNQCAQVY